MTRRSAGRQLQFVGLAHGAVGAVVYRDVLADLARGNPLGSVPDRGDRATAFWFLAAAPALWMGGRLLRSAEEHRDVPAQRADGGQHGAGGVAGTAVMPKGGFPALAAIGGLVLRRTLRG
ncbi:DUF6463 family protein [Streptomyces geysiriensis]|uniref:DUF6463 family protein n=1 Tax=Streptomyces geysiriensis TaxID=68207 RepID=UPI001C7E14CC|nr:DUF6463 family protein [Streptomyces geysiriensis]MBX4174553.1 hypothetical protein [Streptomyces geysiriensis]